MFGFGGSVQFNHAGCNIQIVGPNITDYSIMLHHNDGSVNIYTVLPQTDMA
jgi:hypothetical protein